MSIPRHPLDWGLPAPRPDATRSAPSPRRCLHPCLQLGGSDVDEAVVTYVREHVLSLPDGVFRIYPKFEIELRDKVEAAKARKGAINVWWR